MPIASSVEPATERMGMHGTHALIFMARLSYPARTLETERPAEIGVGFGGLT
jgi:hypothetical protein